jgi:hypothetical protein
MRAPFRVGGGGFGYVGQESTWADRNSQAGPPAQRPIVFDFYCLPVEIAHYWSRRASRSEVVTQRAHVEAAPVPVPGQQG